jgi:hypothetical protein
MFPQPPRRVARKAAFAATGERASAAAKARRLQAEAAIVHAYVTKGVHFAPAACRRCHAASERRRSPRNRQGITKRSPGQYGACTEPDCYEGSSFRYDFSNSQTSNNREDIGPRSRGAWRPSDAAGMSLFQSRGRREGRVSADTHGPRATEPQVQPDIPALPARMVLTVSFVLSPVTMLGCHRRPQDA